MVMGFLRDPKYLPRIEYASRTITEDQIQMNTIIQEKKIEKIEERVWTRADIQKFLQENKILKEVGTARGFLY